LNLPRAPTCHRLGARAASASGFSHWHEALLQDVQNRLNQGEPAIMATLTRQFERILLQAALNASRGRRVEAASRLGIGRNTISRKLRELALSDQ
jgi:two-component system nitrogen regulation response regulator GlnG